MSPGISKRCCSTDTLLLLRLLAIWLRNLVIIDWVRRWCLTSKAMSTRMITDNIATGVPIAAPSLELPWDEGEGLEELRLSDGMALVLVEEMMETSGRVKFEVDVARRPAVRVVLDKNISIARYWRYVSSFQVNCYLNNVLLSVVEGGTTSISDAVANIVDGM